MRIKEFVRNTTCFWAMILIFFAPITTIVSLVGFWFWVVDNYGVFGFLSTLVLVVLTTFLVFVLTNDD